MDSIDFLPERIRVARQRRRRIQRQAYLLVCCAAALVALWYVRQGRIQTAQAELETLSGRVANVQKQLEFRESLERQQADLMVMRLIEQDLGSRVNALEVLAELDGLLPESIALQEMRLETMPIKVPVRKTHTGQVARRATEASKQSETVVKRVRLVLTGLSPTDVDVANFIGQLSASPLFEDVNMGYTRNEEYKGRRARKFQASCYVVR